MTDRVNQAEIIWQGIRRSTGSFDPGEFMVTNVQQGYFSHSIATYAWFVMSSYWLIIIMWSFPGLGTNLVTYYTPFETLAELFNPEQNNLKI